MPKREDEYWAGQKDNLKYCYKHKRYYRADLNCQLCQLEEFAGREQPSETVQLKKCPNCKRMSLFWNKYSNLFECLNTKCKRRFTDDEYRRIVESSQHAEKQKPQHLQRCPHCGQGMLQWNSSRQKYECLNISCKFTFSQDEYKSLIETRDLQKHSGKPIKTSNISKLISNIPLLRRKRAKTAKPFDTIRWQLMSLSRTRWFLILLGLAIVFVSIGYYPSLFGQSGYARWMEIPVETLGAILVLIGLFRRGYRRRMRLIRTLLIFFIIFTAASCTYIYLDQSGRVNQWLHRSSSEGTISGNIKNKIPSLVDTIGGLKLETPAPTVTPNLPRVTPIPASTTSRVWIDGSYLVGGDGNPIILVNNPNAKNPSWNQLVSFLASDPTDKQKYVYNSFVCADFAEMLHNNAEKAGWRAAYVSIQLGPCSYLQGGGHALNAFQTTDRGLVYIDCTAPIVPSGSADKVVDVAVGKDYVPVSIFPQPGWESTWESMGRVLSIETVQW
jgi:hypothetical protein